MATEHCDCLACKAERFWKATGEFRTRDERNHWMLWGCTGTPEAAAEANAFMEAVTR